MSEPKKNSVEQQNIVPEKMTTNFIITGETKEIAQKKETIKSPLQIAKQTVIEKGNNEVRNVSEYFKAFRKLSFDKPDLDKDGKQKTDKDGNLLWIDSEVTILLKEMQLKNRKFDAKKVDMVINDAKLSVILEADDFLQSKRTQPIKVWSMQRLTTAFLFATEIKKTNSPK